MEDALSMDRLKGLVGKELGVSGWLEITQERINAFAECTEDRQWIHVDPEKAKQGPFGGTIAHGFLLLSLLVHFNSQLEIFRNGVRMVANRGVDHVRFLHPVRAGKRIRNRAVLKEAREKSERKILIVIKNRLEIEGEDKPAMEAEISALVFF